MTDPASSSAIRCRNLVKLYPPDVNAVNGLDLEVRSGECFGLLGPNGAGKTTTIEILEGLLEPTSGEVEVLGLSWTRERARLRERVGLSLQETRLPEKLTVEEIVRLFRSFYSGGRSIDEVLAAVSLQEKRATWYERLSGGQKQRLAIACALVGNPELLFLDEPTTGLDPQSRRQLWDVISAFKAERRTVVLTTHYMDEAERLCDRVAIVDRGRVIAIGTPAELIETTAGAVVLEFATAGKAAVASADLEKLRGVRSARLVGEGWALTVDEAHVAIPALLQHLQVRDLPLLRLSTHRATLEDVFVLMTGRNLRD